jgi:flagellar biosynthesis regulator FlbT
MPLQLYLKPNEIIVIGTALVANGDRASEIVVLNKTPVLRHKHLLPDDGDKTIAQTLQYAIQRLLLTEEPPKELRGAYTDALAAACEAYPRYNRELAQIDAQVAEGRLYQALQRAIALSDMTSPTLALPT